MEKTGKGDETISDVLREELVGYARFPVIGHACKTSFMRRSVDEVCL